MTPVALDNGTRRRDYLPGCSVCISPKWSPMRVVATLESVARWLPGMAISTPDCYLPCRHMLWLRHVRNLPSGASGITTVELKSNLIARLATVNVNL